MLPLRWIVVCGGLVSLPSPAWAHPTAEAHREADHHNKECDPLSSLRVASALRTEGRYDEALVEVDRARGCGALRTDLLVSEGRIRMEAGEFGSAERLFSLFLAKAPHHAGVLALRGETRMRAGLDGAGEDLFQAVLKSATPEPQLRLDAASALVAEGRPDDALTILAKGRPELTTSQMAIRILQDEGRFEEAAVKLVQAPKSFDTMMLRGRQAELAGSRAAAGLWYQRAILFVAKRRNTSLSAKQRQRAWEALHRVSQHTPETPQ